MQRLLSCQVLWHVVRYLSISALEEYTAFVFNSATKTKAAYSSKMVVPVYKSGQHHIQGDSHLHNQYHENHRSHNLIVNCLLLSNCYIFCIHFVYCVFCLVTGPQSFHIEFSTEGNLVFPVSNSSIFFFFLKVIH
jgi:hypothetical protein